MKNIFSQQLPSGQIPTLMVNTAEGRREWVDTLAVTLVAVYLAQMHPHWKERWGKEINRALDFIQKHEYVHVLEGFRVWHFNGFYPPDWEDTTMAIFLLVQNGRMKVSELGAVRDLLIQNSLPERGTGVWIKDPYSRENACNNVWDPTTSLNILRLHYLLDTGKMKNSSENFVIKQLSLGVFDKATLFYRAPICAFFARRLVVDFPEESQCVQQALTRYVQEVRHGVDSGQLQATEFERAVLGLQSTGADQGIIFHHGRRVTIGYGSPILYSLAREVRESFY